MYSFLFVWSSVALGAAASAIAVLIMTRRKTAGHRMIFFSQRMAIERAFDEWADENGISKAPNAVVAFLQIKGCLDVEAIHEKFPMNGIGECCDDH